MTTRPDRDILTLTPRNLEATAFAPYGSVWGSTETFVPDFNATAGDVVVKVVRIVRNDVNLSRLATHFTYNQAFLPLRGSLILIVGVPPTNPNAPREEYSVDYDKISVFRLEPGQGVTIDRGTWHTMIPAEQDCRLLTVTITTPDEAPSDLDNIEVGIGNSSIEFVELNRPTDRVLKVLDAS